MTQSVFDPVYLQARIDVAKAEIVAIEQAIIALTTTGVQSYSINTSQTQQSVTRIDLGRLQSAHKFWTDQLRDLDRQLNGAGGATVYGIPGW